MKTINILFMPISEMNFKRRDRTKVLDKREECVQCDGTGNVETEDGQKYQCPECNGSGRVKKS